MFGSLTLERFKLKFQRNKKFVRQTRHMTPLSYIFLGNKFFY